MGAKKQSPGVKNEGNGTNSDVFASCSFSSLGLESNLCEQLRGNFFFSCLLFIFGWFIENVNFFFLFTERLGFEVPTLVQAQAIPVILSGRHAYPFSSF